MNGNRRRAVRFEAIERLYHGTVDALLVRGDTISDSVDSVQVVLPGAFNPLHDGHHRMARLAAASFGMPVSFELSIKNVDKPALDVDTIDQRLAQFGEQQAICLTRAATFLRKVQLFGNAGFVVGADTIARIADARYYSNDVSRRDSALETIIEAGARFLVFGRAMSGRFQTLAQLDIPQSLRAICRAVSEEEFRHDISSTEIRRTNSPSE